MSGRALLVFRFFPSSATIFPERAITKAHRVSEGRLNLTNEIVASSTSAFIGLGRVISVGKVNRFRLGIDSKLAGAREIQLHFVSR